MDQTEECIWAVCAPKYLEEGETFKDGMTRIARTLGDDEEHVQTCREILISRRFLPAGRIQSSIGAVKNTTAFNCYVSRTIHDSMSGIMEALSEAAETMRLGGGDGFDFSTLRPKGALIKRLGSTSSGPISFMKIWDAMCDTIKSAGHRRGAMMATMRIDHPDIEEFITCKQTKGVLTNFNISVLVTDEFMESLRTNTPFDLKFDGVIYKTVNPRALWDKIMRNTWDHAEPGVLFIDTINKKNNLYYCEEIAATNPCGEQPLPPNGACLLGSFNLTQYVGLFEQSDGSVEPLLNYAQLAKDIYPIVRMMDNVIDNTTYPLLDQEMEAKAKRRMGIGITGLANALEFLGYRYGSEDAVKFTEKIMAFIRDHCYMASIELAKEKGPFPAFIKEKYLNGQFIQTLPKDIRESISNHGIRNSHLLSVAPTGTISLWAGNISSGIEPVFASEYSRTVIMPGNDLTRKDFIVTDYALRGWGLSCPTADEITAKEHIDMLVAASKFVDSACSKTCNVGDDVTYEEFKELYMMAYEGGASGCTTFRPAGFRRGVLNKIEKPIEEGEACFIDPLTGERSCAD